MKRYALDLILKSLQVYWMSLFVVLFADLRMISSQSLPRYEGNPGQIEHLYLLAACPGAGFQMVPEQILRW